MARFWAVVDDIASSPEQDQNTLATVARGQALAQWQKLVADDRAAGLTQAGNSVVEDAQAVASADDSFQVTACIDVSAVDVLDADGTSVVAENRPDRQSYTYTVAKAQQGFFVTGDTLKGEPC